MSKSIKEWQSDAHTLAKSKGWYDKRRSDSEFLMLIASEVFEAFEEVRNNKPSYYEIEGKPEGTAVELADTIIRILDWAEYRGWDMQDLIEKKHAYNKSRTYRHDGKKL